MGRPGNIRETRYEYLLRVVPTINTDACVEWPFARLKSGYGFFHLPDRSTSLAHRMAYKIVHGEFPPIETMHSCDNPPCFNPKHLGAGTTQQNMNDKIAKGRHPIGEKSSRAILTEDQVRAIRREYVPGVVGYIRLSQKYGVAWGTIRNILKRDSWSHVK